MPRSTPIDSTGAKEAGASYLFDIATKTLIQTLTNPSPNKFDQFGSGTSLSAVQDAREF